ncbi:DUF4129 domain-containing protein [Nocardiopsis sediminis]|uniref:DUF4129 domain-containing protein n=1 Tax=Nocardiopsis sediminis TaxID=1778267 RepID=A0ABV8FIL6_9ACTN
MTGRDEGARLAREELRDPIYGESEPGLLDRLYAWAMERLQDLIRLADQSVPGGWWVLGPILVLLALLLIALVVYMRPARRTRFTGAVIDAGAARTADDHRAAADRHAAAGEYGPAVRERLRAITRDLEDRTIVAPRPGRTATELAAEASAALPAGREGLAAAARAFNDIAYGQRPATADDDRLLRDLDRLLRDSSPVHTAVGP